MPLVTIVMPAYNVEKYIGKSIESVLGQTVSDWELIIVNDGSTDKTLSIIKHYAVTESRITVIDQPNCGVSVARNKGLDAARGQFISFLDADDFYDNQYIDRMSGPLHSGAATMTFCKYQELLNGKVIAETPQNIIELYDGEFISHLLSVDKVHNMSLMYDIATLREHSIRFLEGCPNGEDRMFVVMAGFFCTAYFVPEYLYTYIYRENSASRMYISYEKLFSMLTGYLEQEEFFLKQPKTSRVELFLQYTDREIEGVQNNIRRKLWGDLKHKNFEEASKRLKEYEEDYGEKFRVRYKGLKKITTYPKMKIIGCNSIKVWSFFFRLD